MIGTDWTDITGGDYWIDQTPAGKAYWRVLGKVTQNTSNRTARVDFKWQVSYEYQGYTAYNYDSHSYSITGTDNNGGGHSATSNWAFGTFGYNWEDRGAGGNNYWDNIPYRADGTASFNATFSGARWNNSSFSWTTSISLATISALPTSYIISYNANGGGGAPGNQTKQHGTALTLSSTIPTWTGHTFSGWNTAQNGTGTMYQPGGSYTANTNAVLYAQWNLVFYTITYNGNNGTGVPDPQTKGHGQTAYLSSITPTRTGYTFFRWNTAADGSGQDYSPIGRFDRDANTTLYATWVQNTVPVDTLHDCYIKISDNWVPCFAYINVGGTWYFVKRTAIKISDNWRDTSNKL